MKILLIDFYDSFTFNLKHYLESFGHSVHVIRHDEISEMHTIAAYSHVVLSPGPGLPGQKENLMEVIAYCDSSLPILGICLGMQAIGLYLGGKLENLSTVNHGVARKVKCKENRALFTGIPREFEVGLYHSWSLIEIEDVYVDARLNDGRIMAISDDKRKLYGVQFHPESILSEHGKEVLSNFLSRS